MSWATSDQLYRLPVSINNVGGAGGAIDWTLDLSTLGDEFWDLVADTATGYDIVPYDADGSTLLTFDLTGYSYANRTGTIEVDAYTAPAEGMLCCWLYFGDAGAGDQTAVVAIAGAKTAYCEPGAPKGRILKAGPERPGSTQPAQEVYKTTADQVFLWWDITGLLEQRTTSDEGSTRYEEPDYAQFGVEAAGSEEAAQFDETYTRFVVSDERLWVRTLTKAGTDATGYTARLRLGTSLGQILDCRALVFVNDAEEP